MDKNSILKIGIAVIAAMLLIYFYVNTDKTIKYDWDTHYSTSSKDPYGTYLFYELLKKDKTDSSFIPINQPLKTILIDEKTTGNNYFFLGSNWYYTEEDIQALVDFAKRGNQVFIIASQEPYELIRAANDLSLIYFGSYYDTLIELKSLGPEKRKVDIEFISDWETYYHEWMYADSVESVRMYSLGTITDNKTNFLSLSHGDGYLNFHLTPLVFTNFNLRNESTLEYVNEVLSEVDSGKIYWDKFSNLPYNEESQSQSPLSYILSQESLRWAWYILLSMALIYLLFYTKRKQRVIPVLHDANNTSLDYVKTIGAMYFHESSHLKIVMHQHHLFLTFIRTRYGLSTHKIDEDFLKKASLKSNVSVEDIDRILKEAKRLELIYEVSTKALIEFNKMTESFYRKCK